MVTHTRAIRARHRDINKNHACLAIVTRCNFASTRQIVEQRPYIAQSIYCIELHSTKHTLQYTHNGQRRAHRTSRITMQIWHVRTIIIAMYTHNKRISIHVQELHQAYTAWNGRDKSAPHEKKTNPSLALVSTHTQWSPPNQTHCRLEPIIYIHAQHIYIVVERIHT